MPASVSPTGMAKISSEGGRMTAIRWEGKGKCRLGSGTILPNLPSHSHLRFSRKAKAEANKATGGGSFASNAKASEWGKLIKLIKRILLCVAKIMFPLLLSTALFFEPVRDCDAY